MAPRVIPAAFPLANATFQSLVTACGSNANYIELTFIGGFGTAPIPAVSACY